MWLPVVLLWKDMYRDLLLWAASLGARMLPGRWLKQSRSMVRETDTLNSYLSPSPRTSCDLPRQINRPSKPCWSDKGMGTHFLFFVIFLALFYWPFSLPINSKRCALFLLNHWRDCVTSETMKKSLYSQMALSSAWTTLVKPSHQVYCSTSPNK